MGGNMKSKLVMCCLIGLLGSACTREKTEMSRVAIQLPAAAMEQQKVTALVVTNTNISVPIFDENADDDRDGWSTDIPTGIPGAVEADLSKPINCYMITASGPEASMKFNRCGVKSATGTFTQKFEFGTWKGFEPSGSLLYFDVPVGADRIFRLLGVHAESTAECKLWQNGNMDRSKFSKPYVLSTSAPYILGEKSEITVTMKMSLDHKEYLDDCTFYDQADYKPELPQATDVIMVKSEFPMGTIVGDTCEPVDFMLVNANMQRAQSSTNTQMALIELSGLGGILSNTIRTYSTRANCDSEDAADYNLAFSIPKNTSHVRRWVREDISTNSTFYVRPATVSATINSYAPGYEITAYPSTSDKIYEIIGPSNGVPGECYKYKVNMRHLDDATLVTGLSTSNKFSVAIDNYFSQSDVAEIHSNASCTTAQTIFNFSSPVFYVKFVGGVNIPQRLRVSFNDGSPNSYSAQMPIVPRGGSLDGVHLKIFGANQIPVGTCTPLYVSLENETATTVRNNAIVRNVVLKSNTSLPSGVSLYSNQGCTANLIPSPGAMTPISIPANDFWQIFYIKSTTALTGAQKLEFVDSASGAEGMFHFTVD